jgi:creatinine amidohydrolase
MRRLSLSGLLLIFTIGSSTAQIYHVAEMKTGQIRALDKQKTVVILTGGILEQHGPHLPSGTDTYVNEWLTDRLAEAIVQRSGWAVVVFPTIPLGFGAANVIGDKYVFPGSYTVSEKSLRGVYMDLATELGEQGFKWVFVNHGHGAPINNLVLEQSGDYFRDTYGGRMVHLRGLEPTAEQLSKIGFTVPFPAPGDAETKENGKLDIHAGFEETSVMLFLHPELVDPVYKTLTPRAVNSVAEQFAIARAEGWPGYLGSPRIATAAYGARRQTWRAGLVNSLALAILDGQLDERDIPRYSTAMLKNREHSKDFLGRNEYYTRIERQQSEWMRKKGIQ